MLKRIFLSDKEILKRIKNNDRTILGELFVAYEKPVTGFIRKNGGDKADAEDILQETIIALWQNVNNGRYQASAKLSTYIFAIAKNKWLAESRRRNKLDFDLEKAGEQLHHENGLKETLERETGSIVADALARLDFPCKDLLLLFYFEERKMNEIASILGFANSDVAKAKKYQCKKALQKILEKTFIENKKQTK
ncbi:MAG: RNA polymerase sigma factor [Calditrichae bacterium]|nr:RNA polymerase sigma factor [Calditrichota bacterium]MCB9057915.1 RNA polymerase sigma factor [Calditrichia bacterium]